MYLTILVACNNCKDIGHYAQCCKSRKVYDVQHEGSYSSISNEDTILGLLTLDEIKDSRPWRIELPWNNIPLRLKTDSGADVIAIIETKN